MCKDVHAWTAEDRKPIILNEMGKPIGPDKKTVDKFSRFLGTLARNSSLAPLNKLNWHHVVDKDKIWSYVKEKMEEVQKESQINGDDAYYKVMNKSEKLKKCAIKGKCKGDYVGGVVIPDEFLQSYKDQIVKDTVREVMKTFEQQLEPGMFANLSHSLENVSTIHNITKHLHEGTTDQEKDKLGFFQSHSFILSTSHTLFYFLSTSPCSQPHTALNLSSHRSFVGHSQRLTPALPSLSLPIVSSSFVDPSFVPLKLKKRCPKYLGFSFLTPSVHSSFVLSSAVHTSLVLSSAVHPSFVGIWFVLRRNLVHSSSKPGSVLRRNLVRFFVDFLFVLATLVARGSSSTLAGVLGAGHRSRSRVSSSSWAIF
ncbi:hypothetical protein BVRB_2g037490 [Beta vulgaris subsp. vulgaris]|nr:hypothetical protein BVRB_2g037490 [Beta vulgaris subsp. vulgaris]